MTEKSNLTNSENSKAGEGISLDALEKNINIKNIQQSKLFQKFKEINENSGKPKKPLTSNLQFESNKQENICNHREKEPHDEEEEQEFEKKASKKGNDETYNHQRRKINIEVEENECEMKGKQNYQAGFPNDDYETFQNRQLNSKKDQHRNDFDQRNSASSDIEPRSSLRLHQPTESLKESFYQEIPHRVNNQQTGNEPGPRPSIPLNTAAEESVPYGFPGRADYLLSKQHSPNLKHSVDSINHSLNQSMNLNQHSTSNYIPFYMQGFQQIMAQQFLQQQQQRMSQFQQFAFNNYPQTAPFDGLQYLKGAMTGNVSENDVFLMKGKINELTQALMRERETNKLLEAKCQEYMNQIQKNAKSFEEFKQKAFDDKTAYKQEISELEDRMQELRDRLSGQGSTEEQYQEEITDLKRKLTQEINAKNKLFEELEVAKNKIENTEKLKREQESSSDQQLDELLKCKRKSEADRVEICALKDKEEIQSNKIRAQEKEIEGLKNKLFNVNKDLEDLEKQYNLSKAETDSLKSQINTITKQYQQLLNENQDVKNELFESKQRVIEAQHNEMDLKFNVEKYSREISQLQNRLRKMEQNYEVTCEDYVSGIYCFASDQIAINSDLKRELNDLRSTAPLSDHNSGWSTKPNREMVVPPKRNSRVAFSDGLDVEEKERYMQQNPPRYRMNSIEPTEKEQSLIAKRERSCNRINPYVAGQTESMEQADDFLNYRAKLRPERIGVASKQQYKAKENNEVNSMETKPAAINRSRSNILAWEENTETRAIQKSGKGSNKENLHGSINVVENKRAKGRVDDSFPEEKNKNPSPLQKKENFEESAKNKEEIVDNRYLTRDERIKALEKNLLIYQKQRDEANDELQKLGKTKTKTNGIMKKTQELETELNVLQNNISSIKNQLRELNALHSY